MSNFHEGDTGLMYQLSLKREHITLLAALWRTQTEYVPCAYEIGLEWGPSEYDLSVALKEYSEGSWDYEGSEEEDDSEDGDKSGNNGEDHEDLWDALEVTAYADALRSEEGENAPLWAIDDHNIELAWGSSSRNTSRSRSPRKRRQVNNDGQDVPYYQASASHVHLKRRHYVEEDE